MSFVTPAFPQPRNNSSRSESSFNNNNNNNNNFRSLSTEQQQDQGPTLQETITTLHEASDAFDEITRRSQRCSIQIAKWKSHEQQVRKFLIERAVPHADDSIKDREQAMQRREEEYGTALLRLKGVQLPAGSSPRAHMMMMMSSSSSNNNNNSNSSRFGSNHSYHSSNNNQAKATDDNPELASSLEHLKKLYSQYGKPKY